MPPPYFPPQEFGNFNQAPWPQSIVVQGEPTCLEQDHVSPGLGMPMLPEKLKGRKEDERQEFMCRQKHAVTLNLFQVSLRAT